MWHQPIGNGGGEKVGKLGRRLWRRSVGVIDLRRPAAASRWRVTMVGLRWIIVTLAPASHSCAAMSCADVPAPITMLREPIASADVTRVRNVELSARETIAAQGCLEVWRIPEAGREHELRWPQLDRPSAADDR